MIYYVNVNIVTTYDAVQNIGNQYYSITESNIISSVTMKFSFKKQVDMIFIYGETQQNSVRTRTLYVERFPNCTHTPNRIFQRLCKRLRNIGSLATRKTDQWGNSGKEMEIGVLGCQLLKRQFCRQYVHGLSLVLNIKF